MNQLETISRPHRHLTDSELAISIDTNIDPAPSSFERARAIAMQGPDNPRRIEALIRAMIEEKGGKPVGLWAEKFAFNVAIPETETQLIDLMGKHFPSQEEMREQLKIDALAHRDVPPAANYPILAEQQLQAIQAFEASFDRTTGPRLEDLAMLSPDSQVAVAVAQARERALEEARSAQLRYQQEANALMEEAERVKWEKFEPFQPGPVKKPLPSLIGFSKAWMDQDNGWFEVRYRDAPAWTNGHLFDLSAPHYAGHEKFYSTRFANKPLSERPDIHRYIELETPVPLQPAFVQRDYMKDRDAMLFVHPDGRLVGMDKLYYDYLVSKHGSTSFFVATQWGSGVPAEMIIQIKVNDKVVAGVMPIRLPPELTHDLVHSKVEENRSIARSTAGMTDVVNLDAGDSPSDVEVISLSFVSNQKTANREAASALIRLAQIDGRWYYAADSRHHQGSHQTAVCPLTSRGPGFDSQFAAQFAACREIMRRQKNVIESYDSVTTDRQRAAAREMSSWAAQMSLPQHHVVDVPEGPYRGWKRLVVTADGLDGLSAQAATLEQAMDLLMSRVEFTLSGAQREWRAIGKNADGHTIEEDVLGVRAIVERGQRVAESTNMTHFGPVVDLGQRDIRFLTAEELEAQRADRDDAPSAKRAVGVAVKGDVISGHVVDAVIADVPVAFERRKISRHDPRRHLAGKSCTWARAYLDGQWRPLGEPWVSVRPCNSELSIAINFARTTAQTFDSDQFLAEVNAQIQDANADIDDPRLALTPLDPSIYQINSVGPDSYELRFKDPELPFRVMVEYQSPGVYLPSRLGSTTGPKTTLMHSLLWAAREISSSKNWLDRSLQGYQAGMLRYEVDEASFTSVFGEVRDDMATLSVLRQHYANTAVDDDTPRFRQSEPIVIPDDLTLTWETDRSLVLSSTPIEYQFGIIIAAAEAAAPSRRQDAAAALAAAVNKIREETAWANAKSAQNDGGEGLDALAQRYAEFMRSHDPERHNGLVGSMHRNFALALTAKNHQFLIGWLARPKGQNDLSKKFFSQVTGVKLPRTATDIRTAIYGWAGMSPEEGKRLDADIKQRAEAAYREREAKQRIEDATAALERARVRHNGTEKSARQFLDDIIADGFISLETQKVGAVDRYRLVNRDEGRSYQVSGNMVDYARNALRILSENRLEY